MFPIIVCFAYEYKFLKFWGVDINVQKGNPQTQRAEAWLDGLGDT